MRFRVVLIERRAWIEYPSSQSSLWRWRLMSAGNNKILAFSETYSTKHDARHAAQELADALGVILETDVDR